MLTTEKRLINVEYLQPYVVDFFGAKFIPYAALKDIAIVDAAEVVYGQWIDRYGGKYANPLYICSECKEKALYKVEVDVLGNKYFAQALSKYCPNCNAMMNNESR